MHASFIVIAAVFAAVGSAEFITQNGAVGKDNPIIYPGLDSQVLLGSPTEITWTNTTEGLVSLYLLRGPGNNIKYLADIKECFPNTGRYAYTFPTTLEPDTSRYAVRLDVCVDGKSTSNYQYSTQFGMKAAEEVSPTSSTTADPTQTTEVPTYTTSSSSSVAHEPTNAPIDTYNDQPKPDDHGYGGSSAVVYSTHYETVTSCDCSSTGLPTEPYNPTATPSGIPYPYTNSTNSTYLPTGEVFAGGAAHIKAGGALIALAAGIVVFFL